MTLPNFEKTNVFMKEEPNFAAQIGPFLPHFARAKLLLGLSTCGHFFLKVDT